MTTIPQVAAALQATLLYFPNTIARSTGFTQRRSKCTAALFVQTLVFGWLAQPQATLENLTQTAAARGVRISAQGLDERFTAVGATLLQQVLEQVVSHIVTADPVLVPLLRRFTAVYVLDSSTISLPAALAAPWAGCGGSGSLAALKLQVRLDLCAVRLDGPVLQPGRAHVSSAALQAAPLPPGALRLADLGYFTLSVFATIAAGGGYWFSRLNGGTHVYRADGEFWDLTAWLAQQADATGDYPIQLGAKERLPARLLIAPVPQEVAAERRRRLRQEATKRGHTPSAEQLARADWTLYVTNVPSALLSWQEGLALGHARWQIELLFKHWKSQGHLDEWRSAQPWRILCEVYAKLIGLVLQHWLFVLCCWGEVARSRVKAGQAIRQHALVLALTLDVSRQLQSALHILAACLAGGNRLNTRRTKPNTYQYLLDPSLLALA
jgi:hypothetical protein